jgi:hypothetical protein
MNSIILKVLFLFLLLNTIYANTTEYSNEELTNTKSELAKSPVGQKQDDKSGSDNILAGGLSLSIIIAMFIFGFRYLQKVKKTKIA